MGVEAPAANQAPLLYRTEPFRSMEPARRFQLLWQSRAVQYGRGESIFTAENAPTHVLIIFEGHVSVFGELPAEPGPIMLDEVGPGGVVGWSAALSAVPGVCAVATAEVNGLLVPAAAFLEITRYDPAIKAAIFSKPLKSEVWRAVLAEMERCTGRVRSARAVVDSLLSEAVARDWPEEEAQIAEANDYVWVVVGGEGAKHGQRWSDGDGVLWARLVGLPQLKLNEGVIVANALATVPEVSPSRSDDNLSPGVDKSAAVSSSEIRPSPPEPSRSSVVRADNVARAERVWARVLAAFIIVALCTVGGIGWWAARQQVIRTISLPGRVSFTGETRPLLASTTGNLTELSVRAGERVQPGAVLAVVRPFFDEQRWATLHQTLAETRRELAFCENFFSGTPMSMAGMSPALVELAREHERLAGDARVLHAIMRGDASGDELTREERLRVNAQLEEARDARSAQIDTVARDASTRVEELRDAEMALREAQGEVRIHQQSFEGARSENKKEAAQEVAAYRRVLGVLSREVARRQDAVNRLRREINLLRAEATPAPIAPPEDRSVELAGVQSGLARIELDIRQRQQSALQNARDLEMAIERFRADAAPRQILARAPGLVSEVSALPIGSEVKPDTALARLVLRESWQIECSISAPQVARLQAGQAIRVAYVDAGKNAVSKIEPLALTLGPTPKLRLEGAREDWRDGMQVRIETDIIVGSLLDEWLGRLPSLQ